MEQVYIALEDEIGELQDERAYMQTMEGTILLDSAIAKLATARDCLRRAIYAESIAVEREFDMELDISDYERSL